MPIYDFKCNCGWEDKDVPMSVASMEKHVCEECGEPVSPVIGAVGTVFTGSFYKDMGIKQFEIEITDKEGKTTIHDMKHKISGNGFNSKMKKKQ